MAPLSALQHYLYCPRQCALIHCEREWAENRFTAEGQLLHAKADSGKRESRKTLRIETGVLLRSVALGLVGKADVVEYHRKGASPAMDMMEEFRPYMADRLALTFINKGRLTPADFKQQQSGAVILSDIGRKTLLLAWQERKQDEIVHPLLQEKMRVGLLFHVQARLMARHIRGEIEAYPPIVIR